MSLHHGGWSAVCHCVDYIAEFAAEGFVFDEEFVELGIVFQDKLHHFAECFVVYHAGGVRGVFSGVPVGSVIGYFWRNVVNDAFGLAFGVLQLFSPMFVETLEDVA